MNDNNITFEEVKDIIANNHVMLCEYDIASAVELHDDNTIWVEDDDHYFDAISDFLPENMTLADLTWTHIPVGNTREIAASYKDKDNDMEIEVFRGWYHPVVKG